MSEIVVCHWISTCIILNGLLTMSTLYLFCVPAQNTMYFLHQTPLTFSNRSLSSGTKKSFTTTVLGFNAFSRPSTWIQLWALLEHFPSVGMIYSPVKFAARQLGHRWTPYRYTRSDDVNILGQRSFPVGMENAF